MMFFYKFQEIIDDHLELENLDFLKNIYIIFNKLIKPIVYDCLTIYFISVIFPVFFI